MSTVPLSQKKPAGEARRLPPLENGDRLNQKTFHERYAAMPAQVRAELIGGIVYMTSPQKKRHARAQATLVWWLGEYETATAGTEVLVNSTDILGPESEPEPDACLLILPEYGGQTREDKDGYLHGAAELNAEVSWATESIDLHRKKRDYQGLAWPEHAASVAKVTSSPLRLVQFDHLRTEFAGFFKYAVVPLGKGRR